MKKKYGKSINSVFLKKDLNKQVSIGVSKEMSLAIRPGENKTNCPICKNSSFESLCNIYGFNYVECKNCGVAFVINAPKDEELQKIYKSEAYSSSNKILYANDSIIDYRIENIAKPKVDYVLSNLKNKVSSWLDIGCGTGEILSVVCKKVWMG